MEAGSEVEVESGEEEVLVAESLAAEVNLAVNDVT